MTARNAVTCNVITLGHFACFSPHHPIIKGNRITFIWNVGSRRCFRSHQFSEHRIHMRFEIGIVAKTAGLQHND